MFITRTPSVHQHKILMHTETEENLQLKPIRKILTKNILHFNILYRSLTFKTTIAKTKEGTQSQLLPGDE